MKTFVTAVVVAHDAADYLAVTLQALDAQTVKADQVLVIEATGSLADSLKRARLQADSHTNWLWLLHDDSAPRVDALDNLLKAVELSPSVSIAGPKQVDWNDPRVILQQGLTLTPLGDLFSLVSGELDQSQHDLTEDVLAVGTAGALIKVELFDSLGGLDPAAPPLAADFDFSIRARMAGHRVVVVPSAKVAHAALSLGGKRPRKWLGTSPRAALRRASIHLRLAYAPLPVALAFWFFLPVIGLSRAIWRIASKRPDKLWSEISAAVWAYFTIFKRLTSRRRIAKSSTLKFKSLRGLRANWQQVRASKRSRFEQEQIAQNLEAFNRGEFAETTTGKSFVSGGGLWFVVGLIALNFAFWPKGVAVTGGGLLPLSEAWFDIFARAGASYQPIGLGFFAPSDPFVWVLTAISAPTFWAPSLSIALLLLFSKAIAFIGAWRLMSLLVESALVRNLAALAFVLWPAIAVASLEGRLPAIITAATLPWVLFALARTAGIGKAAAAGAALPIWVWVAVAGLLFAAVGASSPSLIPMLLVLLAAAMAVRIRRFGYLIWVPLPLAAIMAPSVLHYLLELQPLATIADPGLPQATPRLEFWQLLLGGQAYGAGLPVVGQISQWVVIPVLVLGLLALLTKRSNVAAAIGLIGLVSLASSIVVTSIEFPAIGVGSATGSLDYINGSAAPHLILAGLCFAAMLAVGLGEAKSRSARVVLSSVLVALSIAPTAALAATSPPGFKYTDARVVPSIVAAESALGSQLKMLVINPEADGDSGVRFGAEIVGGDGIQLQDVSLGYRFALKNLQVPTDSSDQTALAKAQRYSTTAKLVADLASANGTDLTQALQDAGLGYVLVPDHSSSVNHDLGIALDSVKELEAVGVTDFGKLWRVKQPSPELTKPATDEPSVWSITKGVQLAVLLAFILLALPTGSGRTTKTTDSSIFVEAGEDADA
jgi:GT2 family glycosyltransferase